MFLNSIYNERYDSIAIFEIKGHLRSLVVIKGQRRPLLNFHDISTYYIFLKWIFKVDDDSVAIFEIKDNLRSLEVIKGQMRSFLNMH